MHSFFPAFDSRCPKNSRTLQKGRKTSDISIFDFQVLWSFRGEGWTTLFGKVEAFVVEIADPQSFGIVAPKTPVTWFGEKWGNLEGTGMDAMMQLMEEILCHFGIIKAL